MLISCSFLGGEKDTDLPDVSTTNVGNNGGGYESQGGEDLKLPGALTTGAWQVVGGRGEDDNIPMLVIPAHGDTVLFNFSIGTYKIIDENKLAITGEIGQPGNFTIEVTGEKDTLILTVSGLKEGKKVEIPVRKMMPDTSTGDYDKDLQGKWEQLNSTNKFWEFRDNKIIQTFEDSTGKIQKRDEEASYEIIENKIVIEAEKQAGVGELIDIGDLIILIIGGRADDFNTVFLKRIES